jgi:hypothetical protein
VGLSTPITLQDYNRRDILIGEIKGNDPINNRTLGFYGKKSKMWVVCKVLYPNFGAKPAFA